MLIDTTPDAISNRWIYTLHVQELAKLQYIQHTTFLLASIEKQPVIKRDAEPLSDSSR